MTEYDLAYWGDKITAVGLIILIVALIVWAPFWIWAGLGVTVVGVGIWHPSSLWPPWFGGSD
jgi:hypothetical protein